MGFLQGKLTFANVVSVVALFVALGGSAYAATQLEKNSVGTKQLKKNSVTAAKVKKHTITGKQINLKKLGTVPAATHASSADTIPAAENLHIVGSPGEPAFENGATNFGEFVPGLSLSPASFYKDQFGIVHLEGAVKAPGGPVFTLPPGYRPAAGTVKFFTALDKAPVLILGSDYPPNIRAGAVISEGEEIAVLEGITFRAQG